MALGLVSSGLAMVAVLLDAAPAAAAQAVSCIDPAGASTTTVTTTYVDGQADSYTVECEEETGISGTSAYPSFTIAAGTLPAGETFGGGGQSQTCSSSGTGLNSGGTTTTTGSGATEEYVVECALAYTPPAGTSTANPLQFLATPGPFTGSTLSAATSATLNTTFVTPTTPTCLDPAAAGTTTTWYEGTSSLYTVECYDETGVSSVVSYPHTMSIASGSFPSSTSFLSGGSSTGNEPGNAGTGTGTVSASACGTTTSGTGATEEYILECDFQDSPVPADTAGNPNAFTFNATNAVGVTSGNGTSGSNSGNLNVNVAADTVTCIDPAAGGTSTTFYEGGSDSYTAECEDQSGISGVTAYPHSVSINSGSLPSDANQTFGGSSQQTCAIGAGATTTTSGTGATEEYITECALAATPQSDDTGTDPFNFTATGPGGDGGTAAPSGTLTVNVTGPTSACLDPAAAGTTTTFTDGTAGSYTVECYSEGFPSVSSGNYPSINIASGSLPSSGDITFGGANQTTCSVGTGGTTTTTGSGFTEEFITECKIAGTPTAADNDPGPSYPPYALTFSTTPGANGGTTSTSGTLDLKVVGQAPTFATGNEWYDTVAGTPFCYDWVTGSVTQANGGLPLTSITAGTTPANVTDYQVRNVNLANGSAQLCGVMSAAEEKSETDLAPVATNPWGSVTGSIPMSSYQPCTWTTTTTNGETTSVFDPNENTEQTGSQSAFGQPITGGGVAGSTRYYASCLDSGSADAYWLEGGSPAGGSPVVSTYNPLPTETDPTSTANIGSVNSELNKGCGGTVSALGSNTFGSFGSATPTYDFTFPSPWVNGGSCTLGSGLFSGTNSVGTDTDSFATCPPTQQDVNEGYVDCTAQAGVGNNGTGPYTFFTYSIDDMFLDGQPVPQASTVNLGQTAAKPGDTVSIAGGTNWWGGAGNSEPNSTCTNTFTGGGTQPIPINLCNSSGQPTYGDTQYGDYYPTYAPQVYIGTNSTTAHAAGPVSSSVELYGNVYYCTGDIQANNTVSSTNTVNPCIMEVGGDNPNYSTLCSGVTNANNTSPCTAADIGGTFQVPSNLAPGTYNVYVDADNTTALPGNGPNDTRQAAPVNCVGTSPSQVCETNPDSTMGTDEAVAQIQVSGDMVVKTTTTSAYGAAGNDISYQYAISNTGGDTLTNVTLNDNLIADGETIVCPAPYGDGVDGAPFSLPAGDTETCTGTYSVSQADVDNGSVTNTATVSGTNSSSETVNSAPSSVTVDASNATSGLSLVKTGTTTYTDNGYGAAGDVVSYSYAVQNTGTTTVTALSVADNMVNGEGGSVSCPVTTLAPGQSTTCTASYTVTQADVDAGALTNQATASGTASFLGAVASNQSSVTLSASDATSSLSLSIDPPVYGKAGDVVPWTYTVTNTGTTTVNGIAVADNLVNGEGGSISCNSTTLAPTDSTTCTGNYTVTQADVDAGSITDTATASGTSEQGSVSSSQESDTVYASDATSSLELTKTSLTPSFAAAGDVITWQYVVQNTGSTTVTGITVDDPTASGISCTPNNEPFSLAPNASETCTGTYTVTQADVDAGFVTDSATASGTSEQGTVNSNQSSATVMAGAATSSLNLTKTAETPGFAAAGDVITWQYVVQNTGTTTEDGVTVSDPTASGISCTPDNEPFTLAPAASETCTGTYTVTATDVQNGSVTDSATASGTSSQGNVNSNASSATVDLETLSLTKTSTTSAYGAAGDTINYRYVVDNTGPDTLTGITVSDPTASGISCTPNNEPFSLASGASETCTGTYTVTQSDVDNGSVTDTATASGTDPSSETVTSNSSSATVDASNATSSLSLSIDPPAYGKAGDVVPWTYQVTNTGTTTENGISVADNLVDGQGGSISCPVTPLAPTDTSVCTGDYTVTQADVDAGSITDTATASGTSSQGPISSAQESYTVYASNAYTDLSVVKSSTTANYSSAGDTISYQYVVTNTGTTTVSGITVDDSLGIPVTCDPTTLAPNQSVTCTGSYTVTEADVTGGFVNDTATASGTSDQGNFTSDPSNEVSVPSTYTATSTAPSSPTSALGGTDSDVATVTGNDIAGDPAGTVTFYECGPTPSATPCTSKAHQVGGPVTVTGAMGPDPDSATATSASFTPTAVGYWCFAGYYSGNGSDPDYAASSDAAVEECFDVTPYTTSLTSVPTNSTINLGQANTDTATVTGSSVGGSPTGTVSFYECGPTAAPVDCTSQADPVGSPVTVSPGAHDTSTATSTPFTPPASHPDSVGYWCFAADYSGDTNNTASSDTSTDECFYVAGPVTITTTSLPNGARHTPYGPVTLTARGGTTPYKWSFTGTLPAGVHLDRSTGVLSGTPTARTTKTYNFTIKVKDSSHPKEHASQAFSVTITG
jgi:uncharacterized repeat protein (TIGR01451 family)